MTDIFGRETIIGQKVVIIEPHYHNFVLGEVIKITQKGVRVRYTKTWGLQNETDAFVKERINSEVEELLQNYDQ